MACKCGSREIVVTIQWAKGPENQAAYCEKHYPRLIQDTGFHLRAVTEG